MGSEYDPASTTVALGHGHVEEACRVMMGSNRGGCELELVFW
ncbi:hypothetical protein D187_002715 [Cystobacter fuscus DSM 2262]|uniref:Uncharacterized protein n=1 Tax=Cystobacter fuscus (strain ATCC 25194 / DSM 2262 / NBRC 100088 / M29) TaxID=1242864 RepID=S9QDY2_CYSF2|nr:hypothetical protein D187_002715 [Cystobacter fuscus DSM 2262]